MWPGTLHIRVKQQDISSCTKCWPDGKSILIMLNQRMERYTFKVAQSSVDSLINTFHSSRCLFKQYAMIFHSISSSKTPPNHCSRECPMKKMYKLQRAVSGIYFIHSLITLLHVNIIPRYIERMFSELEEFRAFELLRSGLDRSKYLLVKEAKIIAMTCTHAALKRKELVDMGK